MPAKPIPDSCMTRAIRPSRWSRCARAAISGTTPPYGRCSSNCDNTASAKTVRSSRTRAAAVSSPIVHIPRTITLLPFTRPLRSPVRALRLCQSRSAGPTKTHAAGPSDQTWPARRFRERHRHTADARPTATIPLRPNRSDRRAPGRRPSRRNSSLSPGRSRFSLSLARFARPCGNYGFANPGPTGYTNPMRRERPIRIGTRGSPLALAQSRQVRDRLADAHPELVAEDAVHIVPISTTGDRVQDRRLSEIGNKGLFVKEIEAALADGRIDLAVHSLKDMETVIDAQ